jgi:PleD family two-component response regulator
VRSASHRETNHEPGIATNLEGFLILLIEQDLQLARSITAELEAVHADVALARTPAEAMQQLRKFSWSAVITDLAGQDFSNLVRAQRIPLILHTNRVPLDLTAPIVRRPARPGAIRDAICRLIN